MPMLSRIAINAQTENGSSITAAANSVTRHDNNTSRTILLRGIISSEPGISSELGHFLQHLNVQRAIILPHRQDGLHWYFNLLCKQTSRDSVRSQNRS